MGRFSGKSCRFVAMITLTTMFFVVELVTGYVTKSLALVSDSFHMLSDIIALVIGFLALRISKRSSPIAGRQQAEVLGALINSVLLLALCFTIFVDAIQRIIVVETIDKPVLVLIVGCVGLGVNGIGLCLFGSHGIPHGHAHEGGSSHAHTKSSKWQKLDLETAANGEVESAVDDLPPDLPLRNGLSNPGPQVDDDVSGGDDKQLNVKTTKNAPPHAHLNMKGVFLHVLGDALGSVVVIISALFIWLTDYEWRHYVDPAMSLIIVTIIIVTTIPLFRQSSRILLQSLPSEMNHREIKEELQINGSGNNCIATAHILFHDKEDHTVLADNIKTYLIDWGIDVTAAIQESVSS